MLPVWQMRVDSRMLVLSSAPCRVTVAVVHSPTAPVRMRHIGTGVTYFSGPTASGKPGAAGGEGAAGETLGRLQVDGQLAGVDGLPTGDHTGDRHLEVVPGRWQHETGLGVDELRGLERAPTAEPAHAQVVGDAPGREPDVDEGDTVPGAVVRVRREVEQDPGEGDDGLSGGGVHSPQDVSAAVVRPARSVVGAGVGEDLGDLIGAAAAP